MAECNEVKIEYAKRCFVCGEPVPIKDYEWDVPLKLCPDCIKAIKFAKKLMVKHGYKED